MRTARPSRSLIASTAVVAAAVAVQGAAAVPFNFINRCPFDVNMWDTYIFENIPARTGVVSRNVVGHGFMWRHGYDPEATLAEVTVHLGRVWYDISIIPPGTLDCTSYENCHAVAQGRRGFNIALAMVPKTDAFDANCRPIFCLFDGCTDAFLYPTDNLKVHSCPDTTPFDVVFCPGGIVDTELPQATLPPWSRNPNGNDGNGNDNGNGNGGSAPTPPPATNHGDYVPARFEYRERQAGNVPGAYNRVTDLATCTRQRVELVNPVGPLSEDVTLVFRGPMEIYNIGVYGAAPTAWPRLSWYARGGASDNLLFFNNKNVDWSGHNRWGPQIFASADGNGTSTTPVPFAGSLAEATDTSRVGGGPGVDTGVEVNILTAEKCGATDCRGSHDGDYSYRGWGGDRKIFVTRVRMPMSGARPNLPAIWMLNTQVVYTGQYSPCNCRGMGAAGGCGELDIAEVIENQNPRRDRISTHHYFYDGRVPNPPRGDNFASRPTDRIATYVTILDSTVGDGLIKILEIDGDSFDFGANQITTAQVQSWINA